MKEFIKKLIGRLEKQAEQYRRRGFEHEQKGYSAMADKYYGKQCSYLHSIEIVNELAEEYKDKSNIIDDLKTFLQEKFDYCAEQAGMNLEAECNSEIASYFRNRKELYLDRANIYGEVMRVIDRLAEEYINTSTDTSTTNADRIRSMTDEELAELFTKLAWNSEVQTTPLKYLEWLQSE